MTGTHDEVAVPREVNLVITVLHHRRVARRGVQELLVIR
ncbi:hypothetical protein BN2537_2789 [Streptomyces venezuelae]|nr:hypothetical protein BN2537_2789 [Streptomyces venezuelae]